jgi:hypothetical protein
LRPSGAGLGPIILALGVLSQGIDFLGLAHQAQQRGSDAL